LGDVPIATTEVFSDKSCYYCFFTYFVLRLQSNVSIRTRGSHFQITACTYDVVRFHVLSAASFSKNSGEKKIKPGILDPAHLFPVRWIIHSLLGASLADVARTNSELY
jgi:hypothetical protein